MILVRLMAPEEFGLIALAAAFIVTLEACLELGVEDQIVRSAAPTRALYDTAFTLNLLRGLLLGGLTLGFAAPAAAFFGEPKLEPVLQALSVMAAISGATNIGVVDFRRDMRFEREFLLQILPRLVGIVTTVSLAFVLQSHWALVGGMLVNRAGVIGMSYAMHPFRPRLSLAAWRELAGVSAWSWALEVSIILRDRSESLVIGRTLGSASVGLYGAGREVAILPTTELMEPICRACMPSFAESRREGGAGGAENYRRILALVSLLALPAGFGISLVAGPVVALAFGQAWLEAVPVVALIGAGSVLSVFGSISFALLNAHARLATMVWITALSAAIRLALLLALTPAHGLAGAALAVTLALLGENALLMAWALRLNRLSLSRVALGVWRPVAGVVVMCGLLAVTGLGWAAPPATAGQAAQELASAAAMGAGSYGLTVGMLWLSAGRPHGAETDLLNLIRRTSRGLARRSRRGAPLPGQGA